MIAPELLEIILEGAARRAEIKEASLTIVDFEALDIVEFAFE